MIIIEDAAQALFSKYNGKYAGSFGDLAAFSFHKTKNISCEQGGLLVINNKKYLDRIRKITYFGTNKFDFLKGKVKEYTWQQLGGSHLMTNIQAAILKAQLKKEFHIRKKRKEICKKYYNQLKILISKGVKLSNHKSESNYHLFWLIARSQREQKKLIRKLRTKGVEAAFHFLPLHKSDYVKKNPNLFDTKGSLSTTNRIANQIVRLPVYPSLKNEQIKFISKLIVDFYQND